MFTIVFIATAIIVAAADFGYGFDLSWSIYPLTALAFVWIFVTAVIGLGRDILLAYAASTIAVIAYLFVLDSLVAGESWFVPIALPMTLLVAVVGGAAAGTVRGLNLSFFQTLAASRASRRLQAGVPPVVSVIYRRVLNPAGRTRCYQCPYPPITGCRPHSWSPPAPRCRSARSRNEGLRGRSRCRYRYLREPRY